MTGSLVFGSGSTLTFVNPATFKKKTNYTFVTADAITGMPAVTGLPPVWTMKVERDTLRAVYNAGAIVRVL